MFTESCSDALQSCPYVRSPIQFDGHIAFDRRRLLCAQGGRSGNLVHFSKADETVSHLRPPPP
jgi:hypothetical protein